MARGSAFRRPSRAATFSRRRGCRLHIDARRLGRRQSRQHGVDHDLSQQPRTHRQDLSVDGDGQPGTPGPVERDRHTAHLLVAAEAVGDGPGVEVFHGQHAGVVTVEHGHAARPQPVQHGGFFPRGVFQAARLPDVIGSDGGHDHDIGAGHPCIGGHLAWPADAHLDHGALPPGVDGQQVQGQKAELVERQERLRLVQRRGDATNRGGFPERAHHGNQSRARERALSPSGGHRPEDRPQSVGDASTELPTPVGGSRQAGHITNRVGHGSRLQALGQPHQTTVHQCRSLPHQ
jgi:hypothetical protein